MSDVQNYSVGIDQFEKGNPMEKLLKIAYGLFEATQTGTLYGTNHTRIRGLPTSAWDRGFVDRVYAKGLKGQIMKLVGPRLLAFKNMNPLFSYITDENGKDMENYGIIPYMLRQIAEYYKKGILVAMCPDLESYIYGTDQRYVDVPLYVYDGEKLEHPEVNIRTDAKFARHFKSRNCIYAYLPDYGVFGVNNSNPDLFRMEKGDFTNKKELLRRLDILVQLIEAATLARLGQIDGVKGARLYLNKKKHLDSVSAELTQSEEEYRSLYEMAPIAYLSMDAEGGVVSFNRKARQLSGYKDRDLSSLNGSDIFPGLFIQNDDGLSHGLLPEKGSLKDRETQLITKIGTPLWVSLSMDIIKDRLNRIVEQRIMFVDISHRKLLEKQLLHAKKMESIGTLAGGLAHDLNNVLSPISIYSEISLMENKISDENRQIFETMLDCTMHAKDLVKKILVFSKQKGSKALQPVSMVQILKDSRLMIRSALPSSIKLTISMEQDLPEIMGEPDQIQQMIMNLVANASHAMGTKGNLNIRLLQQKLPDNIYGKTVPEFGYYVCLSIADTGPGIPEHIIDKIFNPYFSTQKYSSGIGLSLVHGIVEKHGGYIRVTSNHGEGCQLDVFFPPQIQLLEENNLKADRKITGNDIKEGEKNLSILLVDDNENVAVMHVHILKKLGYEADYYTECHKALEFFKKAPDEFDCIIIDYKMPEMTGVDFSRRVKILRPDIPVILYSGVGDAIDKVANTSDVVDGFLKKPVTIKNLCTVLSDVLKTQPVS